MGHVTRVLTIPNKRVERVVIGALTCPEMEALSVTPDRRCWQGRRGRIPSSFGSDGLVGTRAANTDGSRKQGDEKQTPKCIHAYP